jgi:methionine-S-sulfoxide reductase
MAITYFAAGCFWGVEDLLRKVPGVLDTEVGYTGGQTDGPTYETVKTGRTGHAETVSITYDPLKISYARLLELFFQLHDPTTKNRQGGDVGSQYRSTIFVQSPEERHTAEQVIDQLNHSQRWPQKVATTVEDFTRFYSAESYHQDYLQKNPGGYTCHFWRGLGPE